VLVGEPRTHSEEKKLKDDGQRVGQRAEKREKSRRKEGVLYLKSFPGKKSNGRIARWKILGKVLNRLLL